MRIFTIFFGLCTGIHGLTGVNITNFNDHPGLYFENWGKVNVVTGKWHVVTHFNIKDFWDDANELEEQIDSLRIFCAEETCTTVV